MICHALKLLVDRDDVDGEPTPINAFPRTTATAAVTHPLVVVVVLVNNARS